MASGQAGGEAGGIMLVTPRRVSPPKVTAAISQPQGWALDEKQKKRRQQTQGGKGQGHVEVASPGRDEEATQRTTRAAGR